MALSFSDGVLAELKRRREKPALAPALAEEVNPEMGAEPLNPVRKEALVPEPAYEDLVAQREAEIKAIEAMPVEQRAPLNEEIERRYEPQIQAASQKRYEEDPARRFAAAAIQAGEMDRRRKEAESSGLSFVAALPHLGIQGMLAAASLLPEVGSAIVGDTEGVDTGRVLGAFGQGAVELGQKTMWPAIAARAEQSAANAFTDWYTGSGSGAEAIQAGLLQPLKEVALLKALPLVGRAGRAAGTTLARAGGMTDIAGRLTSAGGKVALGGELLGHAAPIAAFTIGPAKAAYTAAMAAGATEDQARQAAMQAGLEEAYKLFGGMATSAAGEAIKPREPTGFKTVDIEPSLRAQAEAGMRQADVASQQLAWREGAPTAAPPERLAQAGYKVQEGTAGANDRFRLQEQLAQGDAMAREAVEGLRALESGDIRAPVVERPVPPQAKRLAAMHEQIVGPLEAEASAEQAKLAGQGVRVNEGPMLGTSERMPTVTTSEPGAEFKAEMTRPPEAIRPKERPQGPPEVEPEPRPSIGAPEGPPKSSLRQQADAVTKHLDDPALLRRIVTDEAATPELRRSAQERLREVTEPAQQERLGGDIESPGEYMRPEQAAEWVRTKGSRESLGEVAGSEGIPRSYREAAGRRVEDLERGIEEAKPKLAEKPVETPPEAEKETGPWERAMREPYRPEEYRPPGVEEAKPALQQPQKPALKPTAEAVASQQKGAVQKVPVKGNVGTPGAKAARQGATQILPALKPTGVTRKPMASTEVREPVRLEEKPKLAPEKPGEYKYDPKEDIESPSHWDRRLREQGLEPTADDIQKAMGGGERKFAEDMAELVKSYRSSAGARSPEAMGIIPEEMARRLNEKEGEKEKRTEPYLGMIAADIEKARAEGSELPVERWSQETRRDANGDKATVWVLDYVSPQGRSLIAEGTTKEFARKSAWRAISSGWEGRTSSGRDVYSSGIVASPEMVELGEKINEHWEKVKEVAGGLKKGYGRVIGTPRPEGEKYSKWSEDLPSRLLGNTAAVKKYGEILERTRNAAAGARQALAPTPEEALKEQLGPEKYAEYKSGKAAHLDEGTRKWKQEGVEILRELTRNTEPERQETIRRAIETGETGGLSAAEQRIYEDWGDFTGRVGRKKVELGLIPEESFREFAHKYIGHFYKEFEPSLSGFLTGIGSKMKGVKLTKEELSSTKKRKFKTHEEAEAAGLHPDKMLARTMARTILRDAGLIQKRSYYDWLTENDWAASHEPKAGYRPIQVPKGKMAREAYGKLGDMYVRDAIAADIEGNISDSPVGQAGLLMRMWKKAQVPFRFAAHTTQMLGNSIFLSLDGVRVTDQVKAWLDIKKGSREWKEFAESELLDADYFAQHAARTNKMGTAKTVQDVIDAMDDPTGRVPEWKTLTGLYRWGDILSRFTMYRHHRQLGKTHQQALQHTQDNFPNPAGVPQRIRDLERSWAGIVFPTFWYESARIMGRHATSPMGQYRMAKLAVANVIMDEIARYSHGMTEEEWEKVKRAGGVSPLDVSIPSLSGGKGRPFFLKMRYAVPMGWLFDLAARVGKKATGHGDQDIGRQLGDAVTQKAFSLPQFDFATILSTGVEPFTGKRWWNRDDEWYEKGLAAALYGLESILPFDPGGLYRAVKPQTREEAKRARVGGYREKPSEAEGALRWLGSQTATGYTKKEAKRWTTKRKWEEKRKEIRERLEERRNR